MASHNLKKLQYDGKDVYAEVANRDAQGNIISETYVDKTTAQEIAGQKDFKVTPRIYVQGETPIVPENCQQYRYVKFIGENYIDLQIKPVEGMEVEIKFSTTENTKLLFGARTNQATNSFTIGAFNNTSYFIGYGSATLNFQYQDSLTTGAPHIIKLGRTVCSIDGNTASVTRGTFNWSAATPPNLLLGTWSNDGTPDPRYWIGDVYYLILKNGSNILRNLVPAADASGKVGFYDTISEAFYYPNTGTVKAYGQVTSHYESVVTTNAMETALTNYAKASDIGHGLLAIQRNGTTINTFDANSLVDTTINITVPTKTSDITNDSGYLTSHQDISGKANLSGGNTFNDTQQFNGLVYLEGSTPFFLSKTGKIGMRATNASSENLGQINISNAWYDADHYGSQISARFKDTDGAYKYNALRVSHNGIQYMQQYPTAGGGWGETAYTMATEEYVDARMPDKAPVIAFVGQGGEHVQTGVFYSIRVISGTVAPGDEIVISAIKYWYDTTNSSAHHSYGRFKHKTLIKYEVTEKDLTSDKWKNDRILVMPIPNDEPRQIIKLRRTYSSVGERGIKYIRLRKKTPSLTSTGDYTYTSSNAVPIRISVSGDFDFIKLIPY